MCNPFPQTPHLSPANGRLYELAALISDPGSRAQPLHADFPYREGEGAAIVIAFVALQDVEPDIANAANKAWNSISSSS